jgi:hypothetical protein
MEMYVYITISGIELFIDFGLDFDSDFELGFAFDCRASADFLVGAAELFLYEKFLTSAVRTTDPEEADFFYVPTW